MARVRLLADRYRLVERLGAGGMSVVWRGYDEVLGRQVAVKVLDGGVVADEASGRLVRGEAKAAARLSHPNVTSVYDYGESTGPDGRVPFVVMELVEGPTLAERLARGPLPWRTAVRVAADVAAGLAAAHARGLVHRDVKPANVILTQSAAKIVDFGIAAVAGACDATGELFGTPAYVAPERLAGEPVTPATDVYALGVLLYRSLAGALPWPVATPTELIWAHRWRLPDPLPAIEGLPSAVAALCQRCLSKRPDDRPDSAALATALRAAVATVAASEPADDATAAVARPEPLTTILPTTVLVPVAPADPVRTRRRSAGVRTRISVAVGGVAALGLVTGPLLGAVHGRHARPAAVVVAGLGAAGTPPCAVRYETRRDTAGGFAVDVTVADTGVRPLPVQALRFSFPADQRVVAGAGGTWSQDGRTVTVRPAGGAAPLQPGERWTVSFTGTYHGGNPLPTAFTVDGTPCATEVVGATSTAATAGGAGQAGARSGPGSQPDPGNANANDKGKANGHGKKPKH